MRIKDLLQWIAWEGINPALLKLNSRRIPFDSRYRGLNIGCGLDNPSGWLGIDGGVYVLLKKIPRPVTKLLFRFSNASRNYSAGSVLDRVNSSDILHFELTRGLPFPDDSVPAVFSSHFFEHLDRDEAEALAHECHRVLVPGGIVRICVPSLEQVAENMRRALVEYDQGSVEPIQKFVTGDTTGFNNKYSNHRWMYNFAEMRLLLAKAGFRDIVERSFRVGAIPDVERLDTRGGLFVEAVK